MDGDAGGLAGGGLDLGGLDGWWKEPGIVVWSLVLFGSVALNAILLLAFLFRPGLRTISNRFVMNLAISNLLTCAILSPLLMIDVPASAPSPSGSTGSICTVSEGVTALVITSSVLSVLLIAIDQYFAVVDPLRYRSRIDKLKTGILIFGVWFVSAAFALVAALNPSPRSFWLSCSAPDQTRAIKSNTNLTLASNSERTSESIELTEPIGFPPVNRSLAQVEDSASWKIPENVMNVLAALIENDFVENQSSPSDIPPIIGVDGLGITYGLVYAIIYSLLAFLVPFCGVCWIYISIYSAAHKNSERTRRTGSRPILSSGSFCYEEQQLQCPGKQQEVTTEDFRRIPKISSLSSIDETSETTQTAQSPRVRSLSSASDAGLSGKFEEDKSTTTPAAGVVFTVGSHRLDVSPQKPASTDKVATPQQEEEEEGEGDEEEHSPRVPVALLKAEFLEKQRTEVVGYEDLIRSKFNDGEPDQRRKSSHDLMYEELLAKNDEKNRWVCGGHSSTSSSDSSDDETQRRDFDTLEVPDIGHGRRAGAPRFLSPFDGYQSTLSSSSRIPRNEQKLACPRSDEIITYTEDDSLYTSEVLHKELAIPLREEVRANANLELEDKSRIQQRSCSFDGRSTSMEASTSLLAPIVTITPVPNKPGLQRTASIKSTSSYINSLKHRISNGSLFKYREETRAARVSALVIVMGLICWSPYIILLIVKNVPENANRNLPHVFDVLALGFHVLATYVSPLLFGYRSKRVKRELRKFFCFRRELSYKNNRSLMAKKVLKRRHSSTLSHVEMDNRYNIFNCVYGRSRWPKEKVQFVQVPDTALGVETCRSSFSSGASTQISSTSTEEC